MRINVPKKIREDLALIESVYVEMDDTTQNDFDTLKVSVSKLHFEKMEFVNIFESQWQNCSFVRYRLNYLDGREEVIAFESKNKASYGDQANRDQIDVSGFEDVRPQEESGWTQVGEANTYSYAPKAILGTDRLGEHDLARLVRNLNIPSTGILTLNNAILSEKGLVYSHDLKKRYLELSRFSSMDELNQDIAELKIYTDKRLAKRCAQGCVKYLKGHALNLYTFFSNYNFCHSFLDFCALLSVAVAGCKDIRSYDYYIVPENNFNVVKKLICKLNLDHKKFIHAGEVKVNAKVEPRGYSLLFDKLDTPSFNGFCGYYAPGCFDFLRDLFASERLKIKGNKRIYLSRENGNRGIANEQELVSMLEHYGFESMYSSTQLDVPRIMSEADIVIGSHGAAMANCVFCNEGAHLIDLVPSNYVYPYFMSLSNILGLTYTAIICAPHRKKEEEKSQFFVDLPRLKVLLDQLCYE